MDDAKIVELYWSRSEQAISETESKYGKYCRTISFNILADSSDAEECVNDTYLKAWNTMPSNRPSRLAPYLGKLTRWLSLNRLRDQDCLKRGGGELPLVLDELAETLDSGFDTEKELETKELNREIRHLLGKLEKEERDVFLSRYWYMVSIAEIAEKSGFTESKVKTMLHRIRNKLLNDGSQQGPDRVQAYGWDGGGLFLALNRGTSMAGKHEAPQSGNVRIKHHTRFQGARPS